MSQILVGNAFVEADNTETMNANRLRWYEFVAIETDSAVAFIADFIGTSGSIRFAIFEHTGGLNRLAEAEYVAVSGASQTFTLTSSATITAGVTYRLAVLSSSTGVIFAANSGTISRKEMGATTPAADGFPLSLVGLTPSSSNRRIPAIRVVSAALAPPSINPTGSSLLGRHGDSLVCNVSGISSSAPVSIAINDSASGITTMQADFSYTAGSGGNGVINYASTRGDLPYRSGQTIVVTLENDSTIEYVGFTTEIVSGQQFTILEDPLLTGDQSVVNQYSGDPVAEGMQLKVPTVTVGGGTLTIYPNSGFLIEYADAPPANDAFIYELWDGSQWGSATRTVVTSTIDEPVMPADRTLTVYEVATTLGTFPAASGTPPISYAIGGDDAALFTINTATAKVDPVGALTTGQSGVITVTPENSAGVGAPQTINWSVVAPPAVDGIFPVAIQPVALTPTAVYPTATFI